MPDAWCSPSIFWVMTAATLPRRTSASTARWPRLGSAALKMSSIAKRRRGEMPEPDRSETQHDRQHDVAAGLQPMVLPRQLQRLQAEGGKGREAAADPDHDKGAGAERGNHSAIRPGEGGVEADDERSQ